MPSSTPAPVPTESHPTLNPDATPLQAARAGCEAFESGVAPTLISAVGSDDLAPAIRVSNGQSPDFTAGDNVSADAPWFITQNDLIHASSGDPRFQPITDALSSVSDSIIHADPAGDLAPIASATEDVATQCRRTGALG